MYNSTNGKAANGMELAKLVYMLVCLCCLKAGRL